jgi:hypothetical protein
MYLGTRLKAGERLRQRDKAAFYQEGYFFPTLAAFIVGLLVSLPVYLLYWLFTALSSLFT